MKSQYPSDLPWNPFSGICEVFGAASSHLETNTRWNMLLMKQTNQLLWILVYVPEMPHVGNIYHVCYLYIIPGKDQHLPSWYHLREHPALPVTKTYRTAAVTRISSNQDSVTELRVTVQLILIVWTQFHQYINLYNVHQVYLEVQLPGAACPHSRCSSDWWVAECVWETAPQSHKGTGKWLMRFGVPRLPFVHIRRPTLTGVKNQLRLFITITSVFSWTSKVIHTQITFFTPY